MTAVWITIAALDRRHVRLQGRGHARPRRRATSAPRALNVTALVAPALLAALVVYETFGAHGGGITIDARAAGLGAALARASIAKAPMIVVMLVAAAVTAGVRAFS